MSETPSVTVVLVDDHRLVRAGLRGIIDATPDLRVVGEAADGREAVEAVRTADPDLVLMDLSMPGVDGIEGIGMLRSAGLSTPVVVLNRNPSNEPPLETDAPAPEDDYI